MEGYPLHSAPGVRVVVCVPLDRLLFFQVVKQPEGALLSQTETERHVLSLQDHEISKHLSFL